MTRSGGYPGLLGKEKCVLLAWHKTGGVVAVDEATRWSGCPSWYLSFLVGAQVQQSRGTQEVTSDIFQGQGNVIILASSSWLVRTPLPRGGPDEAT